MELPAGPCAGSKPAPQTLGATGSNFHLEKPLKVVRQVKRQDSGPRASRRRARTNPFAGRHIPDNDRIAFSDGGCELTIGRIRDDPNDAGGQRSFLLRTQVPLQPWAADSKRLVIGRKRERSESKIVVGHGLKRLPALEVCSHTPLAAASASHWLSGENATCLILFRSGALL